MGTDSHESASSSLLSDSLTGRDAPSVDAPLLGLLRQILVQKLAGTRIASGRPGLRHKGTALNASKLRGLSRVTIDAIAQTTRLVEALHHTILRVPGVFGEAERRPTKGITGLVYRSIRGVNSVVGASLDAGLALLAPVIDEFGDARAVEAAQAALNGVLGDHLVDTDNPLAIRMCLKRNGQTLDLRESAFASLVPKPSSKIAVLVHGLCMNDRAWTHPLSKPEEELAARLEDELGFSTLQLSYNSGRHISDNGRAFAEALEQLLQAWPVPVTELSLIGHSMGGLVMRSACHYGEAAGQLWPGRLRKQIFLGTPHLGAPLERGGNLIDRLLEASPYTAPFARLGKMRSAGITDLRHGYLRDEDWQGRDRFARSAAPTQSLPLPSGVNCFALAATTGKDAGDVRDRLLGDGLVPMASALGIHANRAKCLAIPESRRCRVQGVNHLALLTDQGVRAQVLRWMSDPA